RIERSTDGVNFSLVATLGPGATSFIDTNGNKGLPAGSYYYRVKAVANGLPDSPYSNVDSVRFALPGQTLTIAHGFENSSDLTADAKNAFMLETPSVFGHNEPNFQWRTNTADFTNGVGAGYGTQAAPVWLRLVRTGNFFTGYWAADINNGQGHGAWNQVGGSVQVDMASQVYVGLALTAHNNSGVLNTSTFDQ